MLDIVGFVQGLVNKPSGGTLAIMIAGMLFPVLLGILLPRKKTISYGQALYMIFGGLLAQKRYHAIPTTMWGNILTAIRATFVDLSFGIYIASRGLPKEEAEVKIKEYLDTTVKDPIEVEKPKE